jgi:hypothetical protein
LEKIVELSPRFSRLREGGVVFLVRVAQNLRLLSSFVHEERIGPNLVQPILEQLRFAIHVYLTRSPGFIAHA